MAQNGLIGAEIKIKFHRSVVPAVREIVRAVELDVMAVEPRQIRRPIGED